MEGLEYALWEAVLNLRKDYGRLVLTSEHVNRLQELSRACGGWIVFDDTKEQTWLPATAWDSRFTTWRNSVTSARR